MRKYYSKFNLLLFIAMWPALLVAEDTVLTTTLRNQMNLLQQKQVITIENETITNAADLLTKIYQQRQYAPVWTEPEQTQTLIYNIETIDEDGLNENDYHLQSINSLRQKIKASSDPEANQAKLDILLTSGLLRLTYHLKFGKVVPHSLDPNWNFSREFIEQDPITLFNTVLASNLTLESFLSKHRNQGEFYSFLKQTLKDYRDIELSGGWPMIPEGQTLKPGMSDARMPLINQRLVVTGDSQSSASNQAIYSEALVASVKQFQTRHTLDNDGVIGKKTLAAMNVSVSARIAQIRVNLERLRWVSQDIKGKFILVNIAGFQAYLVEDRKLLWKSKVQVGKNYRQTPVFKDQITYLEINPTWTIPPTILREDIMPKLKKSRSILAKKNLKIIDNKGQTVDPGTVDWKSATARNFPYMLRQQPGPKNALGRIKFMFPNKHAVYLHDTPSKKNFQRSERAFSSGCIRLQNPFELAELLMDDKQKWNQKKFDEILDTKQTKRINLPQPLPILIVYSTVDIDLNLDTQVTFNPDIYNRDAPIIKGLEQPFKFVAPVNL